MKAINTMLFASITIFAGILILVDKAPRKKIPYVEYSNKHQLELQAHDYATNRLTNIVAIIQEEDSNTITFKIVVRLK